MPSYAKSNTAIYTSKDGRQKLTCGHPVYHAETRYGRNSDEDAIICAACSDLARLKALGKSGEEMQIWEDSYLGRLGCST